MGFKPRSRIVRVQWSDACSYGGWQPDDCERELTDCATVGYLLRDAADHIEVAPTVSDGMASDVMVIPKKWITSVTRI